MLQEGIIDRNVKFTPVLDGFRMPEYIDWELQPFSNFKVPCHAVHVSPLCWLSGVRLATPFNHSGVSSMKLSQQWIIRC